MRNRLLMPLLRTAVAWACLHEVVPVPVDPARGRSLEHVTQRCHLTLPVQSPTLCLLLSVTPCIPQPQKVQILTVLTSR